MEVAAVTSEWSVAKLVICYQRWEEGGTGKIFERADASGEMKATC